MTEAIPESHFSDIALEQLNAALRAYCGSWEHPQQEALRAALERLATEAHAADIGPERVLVAVKLVWAHVPGVDRMDAQSAKVALSHLVERCIEAYYELPPSAEAG